MNALFDPLKGQISKNRFLSGVYKVKRIVCKNLVEFGSAVWAGRCLSVSQSVSEDFEFYIYRCLVNHIDRNSYNKIDRTLTCAVAHEPSSNATK